MSSLLPASSFIARLAAWKSLLRTSSLLKPNILPSSVCAAKTDDFSLMRFSRKSTFSAVKGIVEDPFYVNPLQPKKCYGCGVDFQTTDSSLPGYVEAEKFNEFAGGRKKVMTHQKGVMIENPPASSQVHMGSSTKGGHHTRLLLCKRCYRLQFYKKIDYPLIPSNNDQNFDYFKKVKEVVQQVVSEIRKESIVLKIVDVLDVETSVVPELFEACRSKRLNVIWVINKIDCIPKGVDKKKLKAWIKTFVRQIKDHRSQALVLVSSKTGAGFNELEGVLKSFLNIEDPRWIYVLGRVNSGKSTFVNNFLKFIGFRHLGTLMNKRDTGGVTRSALPGTTMNFIPFGLPKGFKLVDTPGIPTNLQMASVLTSEDDIYSVNRRRQLIPIKYLLKPSNSLIIGGIARIEHGDGSLTILTCYFSNHLTLNIRKTKKASDVIEENDGLSSSPPHLGQESSFTQRSFFSEDLVPHRITITQTSPFKAIDDIVIAGLGWMSVGGYGTRNLTVWVPKGVAVFKRPCMLPDVHLKLKKTKWKGYSIRGRLGRNVRRKIVDTEIFKQKKSSANPTDLPNYAETPKVFPLLSTSS